MSITNKNMKGQKIQGKIRSTNHTDVQREPRRVASRMEGAVKNTGTQNKKK